MQKFFHFLLPLMATSIIAGVILSILGPLDTNQLPFLGRLVYWVGLCAAGGLGAGAFDLLVLKFKWQVKPWLTALGQSVGSSLFVSTSLFVMFPRHSLPGILITLFYVWIIAIVICGIGTLMRQSKTTPPSESKNKRPGILDRLPPKLRRADIYAISAEDHYVRIHTSEGDEMVLMRLSDAIKEVSPLIGLQTHRSWWVAEVGVQDVVRKDGKIILTLKNNLTAPVSRNNQKAIKDAGWA